MDDAATGQVPTSAAEVYETFFVPALFGQWPERLLDAAGIAAGERVLDVGCGTGVLARTAAERVGRTGTVHGVDVNDAMLAVAARGAEPVHWRRGRAEQLEDADGTFDHVVSQFALMFFTDRSAAVAEMARVTRPGGHVVVATWAEIDSSPGYAAMADLLCRLVGPRAAAALEAPFTIGTAEQLASLLDPHLTDVAIERHDGEARFESIEAWVHTDVRGWTLADTVDDDRYAELLVAAETELRRFADADGRVRFPAPALIGTGTAPVRSG